MSDDVDIKELQLQVDEALSHAKNAIRRQSELEEQCRQYEQTIDRLEGRVAELEAQVDTSERDYEGLSRDERVVRIRKHLIERAKASPTGKAELDYDDVIWTVFDGEPSVGYSYKLLRLTADADGFTHENPADRNQRVKADIDVVNEKRAVSRVNNRVVGGAD